MDGGPAGFREQKQKECLVNFLTGFWTTRRGTTCPGTRRTELLPMVRRPGRRPSLLRERPRHGLPTLWFPHGVFSCRRRSVRRLLVWWLRGPARCVTLEGAFSGALQ